MQQATEKLSTVRIGSDLKYKTNIENHVSVHSNLNLNGCNELSGKNIGKEVIYLIGCMKSEHVDSVAC